MKPIDKFYTDSRRYALESGGTLNNDEKDAHIIASVIEFVDREFGYTMGADCWQRYVGMRSKHFAGRTA